MLNVQINKLNGYFYIYYIMSVRLQQLRHIQKQGYELFARKNADYGDAFATYGAVGVLVRIGDKLQRLASIEKNKVVLVNDESLRDTLIDLHNYSAMAIMCLDENATENQETDDIKNNNFLLVNNEDERS